MFSRATETFALFLNQNPAILYLYFQVLALSYIFFSVTLFFPVASFILLWVICKQCQRVRQRFYFGFSIYWVFLLYIKFTFLFPVLPTEGIEGHGIFTPVTIVATANKYFNKTVRYKGRIDHFFTEDGQKIAQSIPCNASYKISNLQRPKANSTYFITGRLKQTNRGTYFLVPDKECEWIAITSNIGLGELRHWFKQNAKAKIFSLLKNSKNSSFYYGLLSGDFDDSSLQLEFARFGLQHLLAISGFHFALIAFFCHTILSLFSTFLSRLTRIGILIFILSFYAFFVGFTPSVLRAWTTLMFAVLGKHFFEKRPLPINTLSIATFVLLIIDPTLILYKGFQFTVVVTLSILLFYNPFYQLIIRWLPDFSKQEKQKLKIHEKTINYLSTFLKKSLVLTLSVSFTSIPLALYHFHYFPLMSILYNLFFPLLVANALMLLLFTLIFSWIPGVNWLLCLLLNTYTSAMLHLTHAIPQFLDVTITIHSFPPYLLSIYLLALFFYGGVLSTNQKETNNVSKIFY